MEGALKHTFTIPFSSTQTKQDLCLSIYLFFAAPSCLKGTLRIKNYARVKETVSITNEVLFFQN